MIRYPSEEQFRIAEKFEGFPIDLAWSNSPAKLRRYKCSVCRVILHESEVIPNDQGIPTCPGCGTPVRKMCPLDHAHCGHDVEPGVQFCPICHQAICPKCGSHDVSQVSRITGYLSDVGGWNAGKRAELEDRVRYDVAGKVGV